MVSLDVKDWCCYSSLVLFSFRETMKETPLEKKDLKRKLDPSFEDKIPTLDFWGPFLS